MYWLIIKNIIFLFSITYSKFILKKYLEKEDTNKDLAKLIEKYVKLVIVIIYIFTLKV